jgi:hypothetical protein
MDLTAITRRRRPLVDGEAGAVRRWPWQLLLVAALAFILGWAASLVWPGTAPIRLTEQLSGIVSVVNENGAKFCMEPDGAGRQRCGVAYQPRDAPRLRVGDRVMVGVGRLRVGDATEEEIMVIAVVE